MWVSVITYIVDHRNNIFGKNSTAAGLCYSFSMLNINMVSKHKR